MKEPWCLFRSRIKTSIYQLGNGLPPTLWTVILLPVSKKINLPEVKSYQQDFNRCLYLVNLFIYNTNNYDKRKQISLLTKVFNKNKRVVNNLAIKARTHLIDAYFQTRFPSLPIALKNVKTEHRFVSDKFFQYLTPNLWVNRSNRTYLPIKPYDTC